MTAITDTPEIVRVAFLRIIGSNFFASLWLRALIKSAFAGTASKWYFAAILIFKRLTSSCVANELESKVSIISRRALVFKPKYQVWFSLRINKLH